MPINDTNDLNEESDINDQKWPRMTKNNKKMTQDNSRRPKLTKNDAKKQSDTKNFKSQKIT